MKRLLVLLLLLFPSSVSSQMMMGMDGAKGGFVGPGDIVSGALVWYGLRAYNRAYATGSNKAIRVCDTATGLTCSDINILATGYLDVTTAAAAPACATQCSVTIAYDQSGNGNDASNNTSHAPILLFAGCPSSKITACLQFTAASNMVLTSASTITQAQPYTYSAVVEGFAAVSSAVVSFIGSTSFVYEGNNTRFSTFAGSATCTAAATLNALHSAQNALLNGASSNLFIDGVRSICNPGTLGASSNSVGLGDDGNGNHPSTYMYEGGVWGVGFSNSDETNIDANQHSATSGWNF